VGEPTGLALCTRHFGYLEVALSARGRRAHASIPEHGENAAEAVLAALNALLRHRQAPPEQVVLSVRHFETTNPGFAVPERAAAWVDVHLPPGRSAAAIADLLRRSVEEAGGGAVAVDFPTSQDGFSVEEGEPLVRAYRSLGRGATDAFRSHSDAGLFHSAGVPTVLLGPGRLEYAHTEEERVDFAEVAEAAELYLALARRVGGG
jgi:acetylornithine deacetylase